MFSFLLMRARVAVALLILAPLFLVAEPSVFRSATEKDEMIERMRADVFNLSTALKKLQETQDGMRSLFDSQSKKLQEVFLKQQNLSFVSKEDLEAVVTEINKSVDRNLKLYDENFDRLKKALDSLGVLASDLSTKQNQDIRTLSERIDSLEKDLASMALTLKNKKDKDDDIDELSGVEAHKRGLEFFKKNELEKADKHFQVALKKNYKPATTAYYLGEVAYAQKRYRDAIAYYKESATKYDKAAYMPTLLLHTALSFVALEDKANAKNFLNTLIESYADSKEAIEGKKILSGI